MKLLVAGAGAVGTALAAALAGTGAEVTLWARSRRRPDPIAPHPLAIVAVSDPAIGEVASRLFDEGWLAPGAVVLHTAGAQPPSLALASVRHRCGGIGVLHPLRALPRDRPSGTLAGTVFGIGGDEAGQRLALALVERLGGIALALGEEAMAAYHAAAVLTANHTLPLVAAGITLLSQQGLDRATASRALAGLLHSAADNVAAIGLPAALTGPIARGEAATVARHLSSLPPDLRRLYASSGLATVALARERAAAELDALDRIAALLVAAAGP